MSLHVKYSVPYTCEIYWCSETVSHVTPCKIFCFRIHVRCIDVLKLYHMSLHVQYSVQYTCEILMFWNCIKCHSMYNILFQHTCEIYWCSETITCHPMYNILFQYIREIYWCSETVSHVTQYKIFCFNMHVRYTDVLKLYHMSLHVQYSVSICMWNILMFWNCITCHSMYNIRFRYACEMYWCSETVSHVTPCKIICFNTHVR